MILATHCSCATSQPFSPLLQRKVGGCSPHVLTEILIWISKSKSERTNSVMFFLKTFKRDMEVTDIFAGKVI